MACSKNLIAVTETASGTYRLKIAEWDGTQYTHTTASPPQALLQFNQIHSWNEDIEIYYADEMEGYITRSDDGIWRLLGINNGSEIIWLGEDSIKETAALISDQNNDAILYGRPTFATTLSVLDLSSIPSCMQEMAAALDTSLCVCTAQDDVPIYAAPEGEELARCYARVPGTLLSRDEEWVQFRIGSVQSGLTVWAKAADLAFGADTDKTLCSFPSYEPFYSDEEEIHKVAAVADGRVLRLDSSEHAPWLIGKTADGSWLILLNFAEEGVVCTAAADTLRGIGPTQHE